MNKEENDLTKNAFKFKNLMYFLFLLSNNFPNEKVKISFFLFYIFTKFLNKDLRNF